MLEFREKSVYEVSACTCDRCGRRMTPDDADREWHERVSIACHGGFHSIFGDGCAISVDLCQHCVRDTLGEWLRISSTSIDDNDLSSDPLALSALRGIVRHGADDAMSVEAMNAAVAAGAIASGRGDPSPDTGPTAVADISRIVMALDATRAAASVILNALENLGSAITPEAGAELTRQVRQHINGQEESALQGLVDASPVRRLPLSRAGMEAKAVAAVLSGTTWVTAQTVGRRQNPDASNLQAVTSRWEKEGKIFSIERAGQTLYPAYIFDELGNPIPEVAEILKVFHDYMPLRIASWFESTNSMLQGKRPRESLATDPSAVVDAARDHVKGATHG
ncbi:hypothetical protein AB4Y32_10190 [Paraburkholderia phymatum]|uniref:Uncharacterized protein n=1 Tax=Paraburkholderia phymatum TaxID=148447 RepID=A0ACC6TXI1_9BURK